MKKYYLGLIILLFLSCSLSALAQNDSTAQQENYVVIETNAEYPGGINAFYNYVKKNLVYPKTAKKKKIQGRVYLSFVIEKDGSTTDITVTQSLHPDCDAEAIRLVKECAKWIPGMQNGKPVKVRMSIPIQFSLPR